MATGTEVLVCIEGTPMQTVMALHTECFPSDDWKCAVRRGKSFIWRLDGIGKKTEKFDRRPIFLRRRLPCSSLTGLCGCQVHSFVFEIIGN